MEVRRKRIDHACMDVIDHVLDECPCHHRGGQSLEGDDAVGIDVELLIQIHQRGVHCVSCNRFLRQRAGRRKRVGEVKKEHIRASAEVLGDPQRPRRRLDAAGRDASEKAREPAGRLAASHRTVRRCAAPAHGTD